MSTCSHALALDLGQPGHLFTFQDAVAASGPHGSDIHRGLRPGTISQEPHNSPVRGTRGI